MIYQIIWDGFIETPNDYVQLISKIAPTRSDIKRLEKYYYYSIGDALSILFFYITDILVLIYFYTTITIGKTLCEYLVSHKLVPPSYRLRSFYKYRTTMIDC